jgi:hypothetical protein
VLGLLEYRMLLGFSGEGGIGAVFLDRYSYTFNVYFCYRWQVLVRI